MAIFKITGENREVFDGERFSRRIHAEYEYTPEQIRGMAAEMVHRFKVLDGDGVTYFWGVCSDPGSFAPLDLVGADYGATEIQYKDPKTGKYETL